MYYPKLSGQHCLGLVRFLSGFSRKFCLVSVRCPDSVQIFRKVLSGVCPVSGLCQNSLSGFCLSRFCPVSGFRLYFSETVCSVSVCPAGQGQDSDVRIFTVAVHLTLFSIIYWVYFTSWMTLCSSQSGDKTISCSWPLRPMKEWQVRPCRNSI